MSNVYIVLRGGYIQYVASGNPRTTVRVLDLDMRDAEHDPDVKAEFDANLERAEKLPRVW